MAGTCIDSGLNPVLAVIQAGNCFVNPQAGVITGLAGTVYGRAAALTLAIAGLDPLSPTYATYLANCNALQAAFTAFGGTAGGGVGTSLLGRYKAHTDFMSGASQVFPASALGSYLPGIPFSALLGTLTFTALLGVANGGLNTTSALCHIDPGQPCATVQNIFNSTLGALAAGMAAINSAIAAMTDLVGSALSYISQLAGFVATVENAIIAELTHLASLMQQGLNFALSKLLQFLNVQPCFQSVISGIASPALLGALNP